MEQSLFRWRRFEVLPSRLSVLTEDTAGDAALWEVCTGKIARRYPRHPEEAKGPYEKVARQLKAELVAVPHWFSVSTRSGELEISLDADSWRDVHGPPLGKDALPMLRYRPLSEVPILISQQGVVVFKCTADQLDQAPLQRIPSWVSQCVLKGLYMPRESSKLSFFLSPHSSSDLPALPVGVSKLSASKFLKAYKIASYVAGKLPLHDEDPLPEIQAALHSPVCCYPMKHGIYSLLPPLPISSCAMTSHSRER
ncbi:MAG: hypothetical protein SGPRY_012613 [Prymnesium sp.]